ncbi:MAG: TrmH family RNA methyltransferase, partial [Bacillota bacterium]|nr:TrmH family RNA methyltransferase [Bacillota bacterium]
VERLKKDGFWITGTDSEATLDYRQADWSGALAILIGSEGEGISQALKKHCDFLVSIPMHGQVNSLNAAVAAGIIVFEAAGKRCKGADRPEGEA